jgi:hypothetical protein
MCRHATSIWDRRRLRYKASDKTNTRKEGADVKILLGALAAALVGVLGLLGWMGALSAVEVAERDTPA